ncbi:hypothetical protein [Paraferrimonas haliotis]|uniref:Lipoprotein n=1 Tax=Paraferrimonas haliotis TaxID=2013866 RepID=A0AA37WXN0_9GAMM|nr:hypothetical protein [Paraferrimonas haliotis]GLS82745.1 hypothetical protein GCM10007894_07220 [Paraferrimonas haliotis]
MNNTIKLCLTAAGLLALSGCGGSDNETPEVPQPDDSISINETSTLTAQLMSIDGFQGTATINLLGDNELPVTDAQSMKLILMAYPDGATSTKYKLGWHQYSLLDCLEASCEAGVSEVDTGQYQIDFGSVDWRSEVNDFKLALEVSGSQVHLPLAFVD